MAFWILLLNFCDQEKPRQSDETVETEKMNEMKM